MLASKRQEMQSWSRIIPINNNLLKKNVRTSRIRVKNNYPNPDEYVNLGERIICYLHSTKKFGRIFWGAIKPSIILTASKSVAHFFRTKLIRPPLWNACDFVLNFNFLIAQIPGQINSAAGSLSRLEKTEIKILL